MAAATLPTMLLEKTVPMPAPLHQQLVEALRIITADSTHSYELAVGRLLEDVAELLARGQLDIASYHGIVGMAVDVLFFFNYDLESLCHEENAWYRASLIHQMGHGMLQAIGLFRPDLTQKSFYGEAAASLSLPHAHLGANPVRCHQWKGLRETPST